MSTPSYLILDTASNRDVCPESIGLLCELPPTGADIVEVEETEFAEKD